jgi:hypothetical protein
MKNSEPERNMTKYSFCELGAEGIGALTGSLDKSATFAISKNMSKEWRCAPYLTYPSTTTSFFSTFMIPPFPKV